MGRSVTSCLFRFLLNVSRNVILSLHSCSSFREHIVIIIGSSTQVISWLINVSRCWMYACGLIRCCYSCLGSPCAPVIWTIIFVVYMWFRCIAKYSNIIVTEANIMFQRVLNECWYRIPSVDQCDVFRQTLLRPKLLHADIRIHECTCVSAGWGRHYVLMYV